MPRLGFVLRLGNTGLRSPTSVADLVLFCSPTRTPLYNTHGGRTYNTISRRTGIQHKGAHRVRTRTQPNGCAPYLRAAAVLYETRFAPSSALSSVRVLRGDLQGLHSALVKRRFSAVGPQFGP